MIIISHRGAAGLAPENSIAGIKLALKYKVAYIEVDAIATKDNKLVLLHDESFKAKNGKQLKVKDSTLQELRENIALNRKVPTLDEAFQAAGKTPLLIDCKGDQWIEPLVQILKNFKGPKPIVACDDSKRLFAFNQQMPKVDCYLSELTKPFDTIQTAKALNFAGVCMLYSIYNPLVYFLAKRDKLKMTMFTVNRPVFAWFLHFFYPEVLITTDYPDRFVHKTKAK